MLWVITDTHINHYDMIKSCGRPDNFSYLICANWRRMVTPTDTIIHLGDCAWGSKESMNRLLKLPGKKILVRGNHDRMSLDRYMRMGWDFAADSIVMKLNGITILFSHQPRWGHRADINIHGHFHDLHREAFDRMYLPLSLEAMGYMPIALDEKFLGTISSWVKTNTIPKLKDIYELRQNHRPLSKRDMYGRTSKENFTLEYLKHTLQDSTQRRMTFSEKELASLREKAAGLDIDSLLANYGITEKIIQKLSEDFESI